MIKYTQIIFPNTWLRCQKVVDAFDNVYWRGFKPAISYFSTLKGVILD